MSVTLDFSSILCIYVIIIVNILSIRICVVSVCYNVQSSAYMYVRIVYTYPAHPVNANIKSSPTNDFSSHFKLHGINFSGCKASHFK